MTYDFRDPAYTNTIHAQQLQQQQYTVYGHEMASVGSYIEMQAVTHVAKVSHLNAVANSLEYECYLQPTVSDVVGRSWNCLEEIKCELLQMENQYYTANHVTIEQDPDEDYSWNRVKSEIFREEDSKHVLLTAPPEENYLSPE